MDSAFVNLFGVTCGYGITPVAGIYCVRQEANTNSPFGENYMLFTLGYIVIYDFLIDLGCFRIHDSTVDD